MVVSEFVSAGLVTHSALLAKPKSFASRFTLLMARIRTQLLGGIFFACLLPAIVRRLFENNWSFQNLDVAKIYDASLVGTIWAFLLGFLVFRKVTSFPGVRASGFVLPAFAVAYGITIIAFFLLRLDYSRAQFLVSFLLIGAFFYFVFFIMRRANRLNLALIPLGNVSGTQQLKLVNWHILSSPMDAAGTMPIVVDLDADFDPEWLHFITDCTLRGRPVYNAKHVIESLSGRVQVRRLSENTFGSLIPDSLYSSAKWHFDVLLAIVALLVAFPSMLMVALVIRLDSPGPSLFRQERVGFRGAPFTLYKFRTMRHRPPTDVINRDDEVTQTDDVRITPIGRLLRRTRLDELPQIVNVLKGEMSWIGPRPEAMQLSTWYAAQIPYYHYRHIVRPGLTGWAQVNQGHVTTLEDADTKLQYDLFYVKHFSLWLDILVLLRTVRVVITGKGAK